MIRMNEITKLGRRIAREFRPQRIILFGSYAEGKATADSDVDLLVVMPYRGRAVDQSVAIRLRTAPSFPVDLFVQRPSEIRRRLAMGDQFMRDILEKGKVIHEANDA